MGTLVPAGVTAMSEVRQSFSSDGTMVLRASVSAMHMGTTIAGISQSQCPPLHRGMTNASTLHANARTTTTTSAALAPVLGTDRCALGVMVRAC